MKKSFYLLPIFLATLTVNAQQTYTFDCNGTEITISIEEYQAFSQTDFNFDDVINDADLLFLFGCDDESTDFDFEWDIDAEIPDDFDDLIDSLDLNFNDGSFDFTGFGDAILVEEYQGNSLLDFDDLIDSLDLNFNDGSVDFTDFIGNIIDFDNQTIDLDNFDYYVIGDTFFINEFCMLNDGEEFDFSFQNNSYVFNRMSAPASVLEQRELVEILDLQGRRVSFRPNQPLIYLYKDGTFEKRMTLDR